MKTRFLLLFFGMMLSASAGYAISASDHFVDRLFDEAGVNQKEGGDYKELEALSGGGEDAFQNLYLYVYQTVLEQPQEASLEEMAKTTDYSKNELKEIIFNGDITSIKETIQKRDGTEAVNQEAIIAEYTQLTQNYQGILLVYRENYSLAYEAFAKEMFMDDDLSNSGRVDLIYDLRLIYYLLFGEEFVLPDREGEETDVILSSEFESEEAFEDPLLILTEDVSPDAAYCGPGADLMAALEEFEAKSYLEDKMEDSEGLGGFELNPPKLGDPGSYLGGLGSPDLAGMTSKQNLEDFLSTISGHPGDWARELPCTDLFCVEVNFVPESYGTTTGSSDSEPEFLSTQNCVMCHLTYILDSLEETTSGSLVTNKVPMNFLEDGTCKEAGLGVQLDMNVFFIPKPIVPEPGDQTEHIPSINADEFEDALVFTAGLPGVYSVDSDDLNVDTQRITFYYEGANQLQVLNQIEDAQAIREQEIQAMYDEFFLETDAQSSLILYEQASVELSRLQLTFEEFNQALIDTYLGSDAPLSSLGAKPYCQ